MGGFEHHMALGGDELFLRLGGLAPEDEDDRLGALAEPFDDPIGKELPAFASMGVGLMRAHGQHRVEQQHTFPCPLFKIAVFRHRATNVGLKLLVDIDQRRR